MEDASARRPTQPAERSSASLCARRSFRRPKLSDQVVHVIDDDDAVRESLGFVLESAGYVAVTYGSAVQFLGECRRDMTCCIVTDVRMEEMNGLEQVRRLQALDIGLPVVVMTGHGD